MKSITINHADIELFAALLARLVCSVSSELDDWDAFDVCEDYLKENNELNLETITILGALLRADAVNDPRKHILN